MTDTEQGPSRICPDCLGEFPLGQGYDEHDCPGRPPRRTAILSEIIDEIRARKTALLPDGRDESEVAVNAAYETAAQIVESYMEPRRRAPKIPTHAVKTRNPGAIQ